jgi:plasmid maintenance system antidote protein VapI
MQNNLTNTMNSFFAQRPAVTVAGFANEVGCCRYTINLIRNGKVGVSNEMLERMIAIMNKYGYEVKNG